MSYTKGTEHVFAYETSYNN